MTWQLISAILAAIALIFVQWLKTRDVTQKALDEKNRALEALAEQKRQEEQAADEILAKDIVDSGSVDRAIGFVLDSFGGPSKLPPKVPPS